MNVQGLAYRLITLTLGALMMAFAWPVRGQFGHEWGAAVTGVFAGAAVLLIPKMPYRRAFGQAALFGLFGFVLGSENLAYGALIDNLLKEPSLKNCVPQLLTLFFIGSSWGGIGGAYLGLGLSEKPVPLKTLLVFWGTGIFLVGLTFFFATNLQAAALLTALLVFLLVYNAAALQSRMLSLFTSAGFLSFGFGFLGAVLILYYGNKGALPGPEGWWTLRDQIWGGAGGLGLVWAAWHACRRGLQPRVYEHIPLQRFCYGALLPGVCLVNTWNVYEKWFKSSPMAEDPAAALIVLVAGVLLLIAVLLFFLFVSPGLFTSPLLKSAQLASLLFFAAYLAFFAIAKSIVYSGWGIWETGFSLFLASLLIFFLSLPFVLLGSEVSEASL